jgi:stage II sporulation protein D
VYRGTERITPQVRRAAEATRGEVAVYDDRLIHAVYHASSGGHTAANDDVWDANGPLPYLPAHPDPYDDASPHHGWRVTLDRSRLLDRLSERYGFRVAGFQVAEHSPDGRVAQVKLLQRGGSSRVISGNDFRLFANRQTGGRGLRSTLFAADRRGDRYVFEGSGYGHGVGMSQHGAHAMAQSGRSYREILAFYYPGVALARLDGESTGAGPALTDATPLPSSSTDQPAPAPAATPRLEEEPVETTQARIGW